MTRSAARAAWPGEDVAIQSLYRELGSPWVAIQKKKCIVAEGGDFGLRYSALGLRYGSAMRHDTELGAATPAAGARVAIQILYHDRKGPATRPCVTTQRCNTAR